MMIEAIIGGAALGVVHGMGKAGLIAHYGSLEGAGPRFWLFWMASVAVATYASPDDVTGGLMAAAAFWGGFMAADVTGNAIREAVGR